MSPEQLTNDAVKIVIILDFLFSIFLAARMPGTLQPNPATIDIKDLPCNPNFPIILSMTNTTLDIYPESSMRDMKKNKTTI